MNQLIRKTDKFIKSETDFQIQRKLNREQIISEE